MFFAPFKRNSQKKSKKKQNESDSDEEMFKIQKNMELLNEVEQVKIFDVENTRVMLSDLRI